MDPAQQRHARWTQCSYSGNPLAEPLVADEGGSLYNKSDLVEGLAKKAAGGGWPHNLAHIRLKDLYAVRPLRNADYGKCDLLCRLCFALTAPTDSACIIRMRWQHRSASNRRMQCPASAILSHGKPSLRKFGCACCVSEHGHDQLKQAQPFICTDSFVCA